MRVFVTGGSGYIGHAVVRALVRAGHEVAALHRGLDEARLEALPRPARWIKGDLVESAAWRGEAKAADAIVHAAMAGTPDRAAIDRAALDAILAAAREAKAPRTVVYTSGVWVLGQTGDRAADETASVDRPAELVAWRPAHEQLVLSEPAPVTGVVVRPGVVFGGGGTVGLMADFVKPILNAREDETPAVTFVGDGRNRWATVEVDDLADLYRRAVELAPSRLAGRAPGERVFHAVDGTQDRVREIAQAAILALGSEVTPGSWPLEQARRKLGAYADALALDQVVTSVRSEQVLGWRPRFRGFVRNAVEALDRPRQGLEGA
jgi:nucleoside-diphosphate-sugar epimerase